MYCSKCGREFKPQEQFCEACGNRREVQVNIKKNNNVLKVMGAVLICIILSSAVCYYFIMNKTHTFSEKAYYERALKVVNPDGKNGLKNSDLEIVSEDIFKDSRNRKLKKITFKVKDTDFVFDIYPEYGCGNGGFCIDGSCGCFIRKYHLVSNAVLGTYFIEQYNKSINYDNRYCSGNCYKTILYTNNKSDLMGIIDYLNGLLDYINNLSTNNKKLIKSNSSIAIQITNANYLDVAFVEENGIYHMKFDEDYEPADGKLETYVNNYLVSNNIYLY